MFWLVTFILVALILSTVTGRIVVGATVLALGSLLMAWISGFGFFLTLARVCAAVIVIVIVGGILLALID